MSVIRASDEKEKRQGGVLVKERPKTKKPQMYKVLLHNDHYSTMEFVVFVLMVVFNKDEAEATRIMLEVHRMGIGVCGVYTREIAETKVNKVLELAREAEYPLQCTYEEA